jgi:hypothetical protein
MAVPDVPLADGQLARRRRRRRRRSGVAVEVLAAVVVDRGGSGVGVAGGELHVAQRDTGVEGGHDERRSEHAEVDAAEPGAAADRVDPTVGGAAVEALAVTASQDRPVVVFADVEVDGAGRSWDERDRRGRLPLPMIRRVRRPRSNPRSSMLVVEASLTPRP